MKVSNNVDKTADDLETLEETVGNVDSNIKNDLIPKFNRIQDVSFDGIFESIENSSKFQCTFIKILNPILYCLSPIYHRTKDIVSKIEVITPITILLN